MFVLGKEEYKAITTSKPKGARKEVTAAIGDGRPKHAGMAAQKDFGPEVHSVLLISQPRKQKHHPPSLYLPLRCSAGEHHAPNPTGSKG